LEDLKEDDKENFSSANCLKKGSTSASQIKDFSKLVKPAAKTKALTPSNLR
jgi:hypothetical protein